MPTEQWFTEMLHAAGQQLVIFRAENASLMAAVAGLQKKIDDHTCEPVAPPLVFDRRPIWTNHFHIGGKQDRGLDPNWLADPVKFLIKSLDNGYGQGFRRFMWRLPNGMLKSTPGFEGSVMHLQQYTGSPLERDDVREAFHQWRADHPDCEHIVYMGTATHPAAVPSVAEDEAYEQHQIYAGNVNDMDAFDHELRAFRALYYITTFWLDATSGNHNKNYETRTVPLIEHVEKLGMTPWLESIPYDMDPNATQFTPDKEIIKQRHTGLFESHFMNNTSVFGGWRLNEKTDGGILVLDHGAGPLFNDVNQIAEAMRNGWIVCAMSWVPYRKAEPGEKCIVMQAWELVEAETTTP